MIRNPWYVKLSREIMRKALELILQILAKLYLWRYRPKVVAVTGNAGKTSTKEAIAAVLKSGWRVRASGGNLNNELGVPLVILGNWAGRYYETGGGIGFWLAVLIQGLAGLIFYPAYPQILVLEYGADRPGDIEKLTGRFKPHIGVVTVIGEMPVHVEYFSAPEMLAREKAKLISVLQSGDSAILNFDDELVLEMRKKARSKVLTFGFNEKADIQVSNFDFRVGFNQEPLGVSFKLHHQESFVPVKIDGSLGKSQAWAAAAAAAVGLVLGMNLVAISEALSFYHGPAGRLKTLKGVKNSFIVDDTYNASPAAMILALETVKNLPAKRKILVLGDMLELGKYSIIAHQRTGNLAGTFTDWLITVGAQAKFIAEAAGNQMSKNRILTFDTSDEAKLAVQELLNEGDLILVKGSQGMRMEKIVEEIMAEPERKKELLVRQSKKWLNK